MLTQFVAAFDGCFVYRYTKDGIPKEKIGVRYIFGPKQRVLYDIVNPAKNISLPAISIEQKNIRRDPTRIQNKDHHMYRPHINTKDVSKIPQPIPVVCDLDISIVCTYKEDLDQIISNIIPYCNPYFIISWKIPEEFGMDFNDEIRSEVSWSGSFDYENPVDIDKLTKYRIVGNTSFTMKGWIFPALERPVAPIYVIRSDFHAAGSGTEIYTYDSYVQLSAVDYTTTDVVLISAYPEITNEFINGRPYYNDITVNSINDNTFTFYGKRFDFENNWYLSSNNIIPELAYEEVKTIKFPLISAYKLPLSTIETVNDNIASITLKSHWLSGNNFTIVTSNSAGWVKNDYNISVI